MALKILLVEDNPLNQKIVGFYLRKNHYNVEISSTGEQALEIFKKEEFDIILMDLMLPGLNGYEVTKLMRKMESEDPERKKSIIIALTANTLDNDREKCLQQGMDEFISKPFDMNKLNFIFSQLNI